MGILNVEGAVESLQARITKAESKYSALAYNAYMDGLLDFLYALQDSNPELTYDLHKIMNDAEECIETQEN